MSFCAIFFEDLTDIVQSAHSLIYISIARVIMLPTFRVCILRSEAMFHSSAHNHQGPFSEVFFGSFQVGNT